MYKKSLLYNIAFSSEKVISSESVEKYAQNKALFISDKCQKTNVKFDVRGQQRMDFFPGGSVIVDYGLVFWREVAV